MKFAESESRLTPAFFWMVTEGNDRKTQMNAGRAYVRAQLAAVIERFLARAA